MPFELRLDDRAALAACLKFVKPAAADGGLLSNVFMEVTDGGLLTARCTDGVVELRVTAALGGTCHAGETAVPAGSLLAFLETGRGPVTLKLGDHTWARMELSAGRYRGHLVATPSTEAPMPWTSLADTPAVVIQPAVLAELLAVADDATRGVNTGKALLEHVTLLLDDAPAPVAMKELRALGSNGHRILHARAACGQDAADGRSFHVAHIPAVSGVGAAPTGVLKRALLSGPKSAPDVRISANGGHTQVKATGWGHIQSWRFRCIGSDNTARVEWLMRQVRDMLAVGRGPTAAHLPLVSASALHEAMQAIRVAQTGMVASNGDQVRVRWNGMILRLFSGSDQMACVDLDVEAATHGAVQSEACVNVNYLVDAVAACGTEHVQLYLRQLDNHGSEVVVEPVEVAPVEAVTVIAGITDAMTRDEPAGMGQRAANDDVEVRGPGHLEPAAATAANV